MTKQELQNKLNVSDQWKAPALPEVIPQGDMPGDKIAIGEGHIAKANTLFPELLKEMKTVLADREQAKVVVTVCGGSGVGKSEIASLLGFYLREAGIGSYVLSGDNYPRRIPKYNDAERLHIFRESAIHGLVDAGEFTGERYKLIKGWQEDTACGELGNDANPAHVQEYPWFVSYLNAGREGLGKYLGTPHEQRFAELESILTSFKVGADKIWLKRMGRTESELWYEEIDFSAIQVLIIEWTHGNSDYYKGVDIPILLNSTPQETLAHRRARNRDGATDSPFTMMVLGIEQGLLEQQAHKAKIIISKNGKLLNYEEYQAEMDAGR